MSSIKHVFDTEIASQGKPTQSREQTRRSRKRSYGRDAEGVLGVNANLTSARDLKKATRRLRWSRLAAVRELMQGKEAGRRVVKCMWVQIARYVEQWRIENVPGSSFFGAVSTCASVWLCPICSARITEVRKQELQLGIAEARKRGWHAYMITYTLQHKQYEPIKEVLEKLIDGLSRLKGHRFWDRFTAKYGLMKKSITALEMTYSFLNGGHPHKHVIEFCNRKLTKQEQINMRDELALQYRNILSKLNAYADFEIAVNVRNEEQFLADYIAKYGRQPKKAKASKWGLAEELAKFPVKARGKVEGHYSMFQILDLYMAGNTEAGKVFAEFAEAFWGRWQLRWSDGLKKELGIAQKTDKELANETGDEKKLFAMYQRKAWHKVRVIPADVHEAGDHMTFEAFKEYMKGKDIEVENPDHVIAGAGVGL